MGQTFGSTSDGLSDSQARNRQLLKTGAAAASSALTGDPMKPVTPIQRRPPAQTFNMKQAITSGMNQAPPAPNFSYSPPNQMPDTFDMRKKPPLLDPNSMPFFGGGGVY